MGFPALCSHAGTAFAREHQYLIAGPWMHIPWGDQIGSADFGPEALLDTDALLLRWFNHWLKDSGEFNGEPRIRHFVLGENRWRQAEIFPQKTNHVLYLHSAGKANSRKGDGTLSTTQPDSDEPSDIFVHDPEVPVLAPGGAHASSGQFDQAVLGVGQQSSCLYDRAPDALIVDFWYSPRRTSLHHFRSPRRLHRQVGARLPDGAAEFFCIGIARSSWLFRQTEYRPDEVHRWEFSLEPTSCRFSAGDRIRLEIASSAFPLYDRNPGTDVPSCRATSWDWQRSTQIVYHSHNYPSALYLTVSETTE